jgi:hypothetical protein
MASPKILLIGRSFIDSPELQAYLGIVPCQFAFAPDNDSAKAAQALGMTACGMNAVSAIVADFPNCIAINDDGSVEPILLEAPEPEKQTPLIELVG